jgi:hypothetical protein
LPKKKSIPKALGLVCIYEKMLRYPQPQIKNSSNYRVTQAYLCWQECRFTSISQNCFLDFQYFIGRRCFKYDITIYLFEIKFLDASIQGI